MDINLTSAGVFSLSKVQWSDDRNKLDISTVGALLKVTVNFEVSCREMDQNLTLNEVALKKTLDQIQSEKYFLFAIFIGLANITK